MQERCADCYFWIVFANAGWGTCHEDSPKAMPLDEVEMKHAQPRQWPVTKAEDWCGKFKKR